MFFIVQRHLHKQLFALAIPMILSNITVPLLGLVDTAVIGHLDHAYFIGGSTVGVTITTFIIWLCGFLRMSTTGLTAQALGEGSSEKRLLVLLRGLLVALTIGIIVIVLQQPYIQLGLYLSGGSEQVQYYAQQYSEIRVWGIPASLANLVMLGWLLGSHQTKSVMWLLVFTNLTNVALDLLFVVSFDWQVAGIAWATLIAEYTGLIAGFFIIIKQFDRQLMAFIRNIISKLFDSVALVGYFKLNRDILIRTFCLQICFIFITFQGARLGDNVVAANAILMNFLLFISFGLDGIANAAEVMVGKAKGAKNALLLKQVFNVSVLWTFVFAVFYTIIFLFFGDNFIGLISDIPTVVDFARQYFNWIIVMPILACWSYLFDGIYIGLTQAKAMRNSMIISTFGCFFPLWYLFQTMNNHGIWLAFSIFMLTRGATLAWHFKNNIWRSQLN